MQANERLIKRSDGLLAKMNGEERFLSLGCGHTVAGCKAAGAGDCKTTQPELADGDGFLDVHQLEKNEQYKEMIREGWEWDIVPANVDIAFPTFARIAQKALNVSNHIAAEMGELEVGITMAEVVDDGWGSHILSHISDFCVPSSAYVAHILEFVKL